MQLSKSLLSLIGMSALTFAAPAELSARNIGYTMDFVTKEGHIIHGGTMSLSSECLLMTQDPQEYKSLQFKAGWIEKHFTLYSDNMCQNEVLSGGEGYYQIGGKGEIGSVKVD